MRIGIEAQRLFRKKKHGMDIVALELIRNLQKIDQHNEYFIFVKDDVDNAIVPERNNFTVVKINGSPYPYWEQVLLPRAVKKYQLDILHCTANTAPLRVDVPVVLTLHDVIYLEKLNLTEGTLYQIFGNLYRRWNVPQSARNATRIITVSDYERKRISQRLAAVSDKVKTIHNGVGEHFKKINDNEILRHTRSRYNLPDKFIFFLGNTDPKKNVAGVLQAISILYSRNQLNFKLVMPDIDNGYVEGLLKEIGNTGLLHWISFTGYIPNADLPAIYSLAELFLYPSLRESFGIPILEAMSCGTPVITSNTSSMPEIADGAALLIDPSKPEEIANAITRLFDNKELQQQLVDLAFVQSQRFSWEKNAYETLRLYGEATRATT